MAPFLYVNSLYSKIILIQFIYPESDIKTMKISTIIDSSKTLTKEQEKALFKEYYETPSTRRKREIKDAIVLAQSRHIISIAQIYRDKGDIEDLFQEGMIAVLEAFPNYDYTQDASFMTYTKQAIIRQMAKYLRRTKVMKISEQAVNKLRKINKAKQLLERLKKPITTTEIAKLTNIKEESVISILNAISTVELNVTPSDDDEELINTLVDTKAEQQLEDILERESFNHKNVGNIDLSILSPLQHKTLTLMYTEHKTAKQIAEELNTTVAVIIESKHKGLKRLKEIYNK